MKNEEYNLSNLILNSRLCSRNILREYTCNNINKVVMDLNIDFFAPVHAQYGVRRGKIKNVIAAR